MDPKYTRIAPGQVLPVHGSRACVTRLAPARDRPARNSALLHSLTHPRSPCLSGPGLGPGLGPGDLQGTRPIGGVPALRKLLVSVGRTRTDAEPGCSVCQRSPGGHGASDPVSGLGLGTELDPPGSSSYRAFYPFVHSRRGPSPLPAALAHLLCAGHRASCRSSVH